MTKTIFPQEINRSALIIRPLKPMEDWINSVEGKKVFDLTHAESTIYLCSEEFDVEEVQSAIKPLYKNIFEKELGAWHTDPALWPADRSFKLFMEFFEISFAGIVSDTSSEAFEVYI